MKLMNPRKWAAALAVCLALSSLVGCKKQETSGLKVGYAVEGVTVVDDAEAMSKTLDEAAERMEEERITLSYKNEAYSVDGRDFSCYIANHPDNKYDMYIGIYGNLEFTDELFLSQLIRPGSAFENVRLERRLDPGMTQVYVVFTSIETTEEEQIIHGETAVTMDFIVD